MANFIVGERTLAACWRSCPRDRELFLCNALISPRSQSSFRPNHETSPLQAFAPRPKSPRHDAHSPALPHHLCRAVLRRFARRVEPQARDFHSDRDRTHARRGEPELHRFLALRIAIAKSHRRDGRDLFNCDRGSRSGGRSRARHRGLSSLSDDERAPIQSAQRLMTTSLSAFFWLIPLLPLAASLFILALRRTRSAAAFALAVLGQIAALLLPIGAFISTLQIPGAHAIRNFTWFTFGDQILRIGVVLDQIGRAMLVMITFVGLWIFVFSKGYMAGDKDFTRFFAYLSFFSAAMLGVVIANSLLLLFVSWELVGLASYLLIGFWIDKPSAA